jgi:hypothetical protein
MLLRLSADTSDPRWSSRVLEDLAHAELSVPGGGVESILPVLVDVWDRSDTDLTDPVAALVKSLRPCYSDGIVKTTRKFNWLVDHLANHPRATTAYLALLAFRPIRCCKPGIASSMPSLAPPTQSRRSECSRKTE